MSRRGGSTPKLQHGEVVSIRIDPTSCLRILDVVETSGDSYSGDSFSLYVVKAMRILLATAVRDGLIPETDGFRFNERMSKFKCKSPDAKGLKLALTKSYKTNAGFSFERDPVPIVAPVIEEPGITEGNKHLWIRADELQRLEADGKLTPEQAIELKHLISIL